VPLVELKELKKSELLTILKIELLIIEQNNLGMIFQILWKVI